MSQFIFSCIQNNLKILLIIRQGWAGIPVSRDSREYKPQISPPLPSRGIL